MTTHDLAVERVAVGDLHTYHRNPRQGRMPALVDSLRVNGQYKPIVVNRGTHTGRASEVLAGNHTLIAARDLSWDDIAVCWVDVDDDQAARIVVADNRIGDVGDYDNRLLAELLVDLPDLGGTGYDESSLEELVAALGDEDSDGSGGEQPGKGEALALAGSTVGEPRIIAAHGEVWTLGAHTLVVADVHTEHATREFVLNRLHRRDRCAVRGALGEVLNSPIRPAVGEAERDGGGVED